MLNINKNILSSKTLHHVINQSVEVTHFLANTDKPAKPLNNIQKTQKSLIDALELKIINGSNSEMTAFYKDKNKQFSVRIIQCNPNGNHFTFYDNTNQVIARVDIFFDGTMKIKSRVSYKNIRGYLSFDDGIAGVKIIFDKKYTPLKLF